MERGDLNASVRRTMLAHLHLSSFNEIFSITNLLLGSLQAFFRLSSGSHQKVGRKSVVGLQAVDRQLSDSMKMLNSQSFVGHSSSSW